MPDPTLHKPTVGSTVLARMDMELTIEKELSEQELAEVVLDALDDDDRVSVEFACTTTKKMD